MGGRGSVGGMLHRCGSKDLALQAGSLVHQAATVSHFNIRCQCRTYHDDALSPSSIPMSANEAHPIPLTPDAGSDTDLGIELYAHLEVAFESRHRDSIVVAHGAGSLEAVHHGFVIALLRCLDGRDLGWRAIDGLVEDRIVRVVLLHGLKVVGALEEVLALTGGVFGANGLAVDALCRETLDEA